MVDIESALRPLVDHPESPPRPVSEIASRARRRRLRRRSAAAALAVAGLAAVGTRLSLDSSADTTTVDRPSETSVPTTVPPPTTAPSTSVTTTTTPPAPSTTTTTLPPESARSGPVDPFQRIDVDGEQVRAVRDGDHIAFDSVDFGTSLATRFEARVASGVGPGAGGTIEVRLDDVASPPFATIAVAGTGSWTTFTTLAADTPAIGGVHDLYVTFSSGKPGDFAAVDWFRFHR
jgi:carbohydrate binding protein with CBM6 domain